MNGSLPQLPHPNGSATDFLNGKYQFATPAGSTPSFERSLLTMGGIGLGVFPPAVAATTTSAGSIARTLLTMGGVGLDVFPATSNSTTPIGLLIAINSYNPGTDTDTTSTSTTGADVDATNLAVTFTAPSSGRVLVSLTAVCYQSGSNYFLWGLRDGSGNVTGTFGLVDGNTSHQSRRTHRIYVTGLTSGTSYTYKWAWMVDTGTMHLNYGDDGSFGGRYGPAVMEVWSAP